MAKRYLTPNEVAQMLRVSPVTLRQWSQKGLIESTQTAGKHRRYTPEAVARFAAEREIDLDEAPKATMDVLVVDDERPYNRMLVDYLQSFGKGLVVGSAYDGFDAGRMVQQHRPRVILLDILMPGMDGIEVCERIKGDPATEGCVVIGMTGHYSQELESRMAEAGALTLLEKPFSMDELVGMLRQVGLDIADV